MLHDDEDDDDDEEEEEVRGEADNESGRQGNRDSSSSSKAKKSKANKKLKIMKEYFIASFDKDLRLLRKAAIWNFVLIWITLIVGFASMSYIEGWSVATAFYWSCQTITTVGYGDVIPSTYTGKVFTIFFATIGTVLLTIAVTNFVKYPLVLRARQNEKEVLNQFGGEHGTGMSDKRLRAIFDGELFERVPNLKRKEDEMSKAEFTLLLLTMMNKVEEKDIMLAATIFDRLDVHASGSLTREIQEQHVNEGMHMHMHILIHTHTHTHTLTQLFSSNNTHTHIQPLCKIRHRFRFRRDKDTHTHTHTTHQR